MAEVGSFTLRNQLENTNNLGVNQASQARAEREEPAGIAEGDKQQTAQLQQKIKEDNAEFRRTEDVEIPENNLSKAATNIPEAIAEQRAEDAREAARNEPPLDIPAVNVEPIEEARDPLEEAREDANPLRAPGPSEIQDEPDAAAIETERGQNVSNLI